MPVPEITVEELGEGRPGRSLIDVRQPDEYTEGHVPGATLIPLDTMPDELDRIRQLAPVDVICAGGGRSMRAAEFLIANGIEAVNVAGGTRAWIAAGRSIFTGTAPE